MNRPGKGKRKTVGNTDTSSSGDLEHDPAYNNGKNKRVKKSKNKVGQSGGIEMGAYSQVPLADDAIMSDTSSINFEQRLGSMIPFTSIPVLHFKAMLNKEYITWKRNYKRSAFELLFPIIVFVILSAIRYNITPTQYPFESDISRHML